MRQPHVNSGHDALSVSPNLPSSPALHITITPTWLFTAVTAPPHETLYERKMGVWRALGSFAPGLHFPGHATASDADRSPAAMRFGFFLCWVLELSCRSGRADRYIPLFPQQLHRKERFLVVDGGEMGRRSRPPLMQQISRRMLCSVCLTLVLELELGESISVTVAAIHAA